MSESPEEQLAALERRIDALESRDAIESMHATFVRAVADRHFDELVDFFAADATIDMRRHGAKRGRDAIAEHFRHMAEVPLDGASYLLSSPVVEVTGDTASGVWTWHRFYSSARVGRRSQRDGLGIWEEGRYDCEYIRIDGRWRFILMRFRVVRPDPDEQGERAQMIIADLVRRAFATHADLPAITCGARTLTYREVADRSFRLVNSLLERGIRSGDRVATLAPNDLTTLEIMTGLALGGYARAALHAMNSGEAHAQMLRAAGARVLITTAEFLDRFRADFTAVPTLEHILTIDANPGDTDYEKVLAAAQGVDARVPIAGDDILHLAYSSGSSGTPRASVHTHESWLAVTLDNAAMLPRVTSADRYLAAAPLTHAASTVLYLLIARGAAIEILPHFSPDEALAMIERRRCSLTIMVPTMLQLIATHPDVSRYNLSSLRAVVYAGAPISVETARAARAALGDVLFQTYGQSECLPVSCLDPQDHACGATVDERILTSAGRPCLSAQVRIVDDDGVELAPGAIGEILVSTAGRMRGIWGDPAATAERITADGFVHTNDIGYLDDRGILFVVDRKNDMIISGGFNIWPAEIEGALQEHPAVLEAVAVGIPHPKWGETPVAVVVVRDPDAVTEDELIELCRQRVGSMKKPTQLVLRTEPIPRNALGKLSRRDLRQQYWPASRQREVSGA